MYTLAQGPLLGKDVAGDAQMPHGASQFEDRYPSMEVGCDASWCGRTDRLTSRGDSAFGVLGREDAPPTRRCLYSLRGEHPRERHGAARPRTAWERIVLLHTRQILA